MEKEVRSNNDLKLLIFRDDDSVIKTKDCVILEKDNYGIKVQLLSNGVHLGLPFFLPWKNIEKIKDKGEGYVPY